MTDEDEINRRRKRAREGSFVIRNSNARFPIFSNFSAGSGSGLTYAVEIRDVANRQFICTCRDFHKNGLGTCKHIEVVLLQLKARFKRLFTQAATNGLPREDITPDDAENTLRVERGLERLPKAVRGGFRADGRLKRPGPFWSQTGDEALLCLETFWRNRRWSLLFPHTAFDPARN